ncbi:hypothetical protein [Pontibacter sp. H249]|uniref:hypothetical protein n=1 Tax=Pontibacter sp. H249 TaxID=3133420 RepID=UPI0030BD99EB
MPFNDFFLRLFGFGKAVHACSKIKRSEKYLAAYKNWVKAKVYLNWTGPFFRAYHFQKCSIRSHTLRVQLIEETNIKGGIFFYDPSIGPKNFQFLFDYLKECVQQVGYKLHSTNKQQIRHKLYKEQIERYILTPPATDIPDTNLCNQLYGNIQLDLVLVNKLPGYIRIVANTYTDPYFSKPLPFTELLEKTLQPNENNSQT